MIALFKAYNSSVETVATISCLLASTYPQCISLDLEYLCSSGLVPKWRLCEVKLGLSVGIGAIRAQLGIASGGMCRLAKCPMRQLT